MDNLFKDLAKVDNDIFMETTTTKYTNTTDMPEYIAKRYVEINQEAYGGKPEVGVISATEFAGSDKQILLKQARYKNPYKVTLDVRNIEESVLGTIIHEQILVQEPPRQFKQLCGYTISGGADRIANGVIFDIKTTTTHKVRKLFKELDKYDPNMSLKDMKVKLPTLFLYTIQMSIYSWLYDLSSEVGYLSFIIKNWSQQDRSSIGEKSFDQPIQVKPADEVIEYLTERLNNIAQYEKTGYMPMCSEQELGIHRESIFKLVKNPQKPRRVNGSKEYSSAGEAVRAQVDFPNTVIHEVKTNPAPMSCLYYCDYSKAGVCQQGEDVRISNE